MTSHHTATTQPIVDGSQQIHTMTEDTESSSPTQQVRPQESDTSSAPSAALSQTLDTTGYIDDDNAPVTVVDTAATIAPTKAVVAVISTTAGDEKAIADSAAVIEKATATDVAAEVAAIGAATDEKQAITAVSSQKVSVAVFGEYFIYFFMILLVTYPAITINYFGVKFRNVSNMYEFGPFTLKNC